MPLSTYSALHPTNDLVLYDASVVEYPASNVVDTFGQIWVSKVHGHELSALEVASAGKISFTPSNEHSLDLSLDPGAVTFRARNDRALALHNEDSTASFELSQGGDATVAAADSLLRAGAGGILLEAGGAEVMLVGAGGASVSNLTVNGTGFRVPVGSTAERPASGPEGSIFYNSSASRFEGYSSGAWSGMGGTVDVDQDTYVSAEASPNADNDELLFVTAGGERMRIDSSGRVGLGTDSPLFDLDVRGEVQLATAGGNVLRVDASGLTLDAAAGSNLFAAAAGQGHAFDVGGSRVASVDASGLSASNLTVNGSTLVVPRGPEADRPSGAPGQVYYNEDAGRFEGFASSAWGGLGGTVDVDQDTFVAAEEAPGDDDDRLRFVTAGEERMRIDGEGRLGYGTSNPEYTLDIVGDVRITGNLIAASTTLGDDGLSMRLGVKKDGSADVVDGPDTNSGAGLTVAGVPDSTLFLSSHRDRFEKSIRWNYGVNGMADLGGRGSWATESYWKLNGGAFHLSHTNADSGAEIEFIMRCNDRDELQFVRHIRPVDGGAETFDVIANFGNVGPGTGVARQAQERGFVSLDPDRTSLDAGAGTVDAFVDSFSSYSAYTVRGALYPVDARPSTADVLAAVAAGHGYASGTLPAATDNTTTVALSTLADGSPVPDSLLKFAAVTTPAGGGSPSTSPHVSFVVQGESVFRDAPPGAAPETQTSVAYTMSFSELTWDELSAADQAAFREWLEGQVIASAKEKGIDVLDVEILFESGSIIASTSLSFPSRDLTKAVGNAVDSDPMSVISKAEAAPVPFVDRPAYAVSRSAVSRAAPQVVRSQSAPVVLSVSETDSTDSSITVAYEVSEANPELSVTTLHVLATQEPLALSVVPGAIKRHQDARTFAVSSTSGTATVPIDASVRTYLYFVAENDAARPVLSPRFSITSEPFSVILPSGLPLSGDTGRYGIARQAAPASAVAVQPGLAVYSDAASASAHLMLFEDGDPAIPGNAAEARARLDAGASAASAPM